MNKAKKEKESSIGRPSAEKSGKVRKKGKKAVTKVELINLTAELRSAIVPETALYVDAFLEALMSELEKGNDVLLSGFGKFIIKERPERKRKNPFLYVENPDIRDEDTLVTVGADRTLSFKVSPTFKGRLNPDREDASGESD